MVTVPPANTSGKHLAVVMDPIEAIHPEKDTTLALLLEAQRREYEITYLLPEGLRADGGTALGRGHRLRVADSDSRWFELGDYVDEPLSAFDVILMRKDPPFDEEYIYLTYLLELAEAAGTVVVNKPAALRDYNEKAAILKFPEFAPPTLIARDASSIRAFRRREGRVVVKPLNGMGGRGVFVLEEGDPNLSSVIETLTHGGREHVMAQSFLPEIADGDKRVLLVDGRPVPYLLARVPAEGESRGNLAAGGRGEPRPLGPQEQRIAELIGPGLAAAGLLFVGLDMIGTRLTEVNVTSPTCVRELDRAYGLNIAGDLFDAVEARLRETP